VVHGAPALVEWLRAKRQLLLVGPDSESRQWVGDIATISGHPFVVGSKQRRGDRDVTVTLPDLHQYRGREVVIVDDIIASGHTLLECIGALRDQGVATIHCIAVHGVFTEGVYAALMKSGLSSLNTTNTIPHASNTIDVTSLLVPEIILCMEKASAREIR
jgi:ribose-phosphate pyrophosphokinase